METITFQDFEKIGLYVGTVLAMQAFPEARKPAWKLTIDFGPLGIKQSSAQITDLYTPENLVNTQVIAVLNFPPKKIAGFKSEVLVTGVIGLESGVVLIRPEFKVPNGSRIA
jgi:tRNA-binding protein